MKFIRYFMIFILIFINSEVYAEVTLSRVHEHFPDRRSNPHLLIKGEIKKGDYQSAINAVKETYLSGDIGHLFVMLDSCGGDVLEAMKIGKLIRKLKLSTFATYDKCHSSCILILIAGVERVVFSSIGIHRPFFKKEYFAGLPADEAQKKYEEMTKATERYLLEMGATKEFIEKMFRIPSNELEILSFKEAEKWFSGNQASLDEWLIAKCGSYSKDESSDYNMWRINKLELKPGYATYLKNKITRIDACRKTAIAKERESVAAKLFPPEKNNLKQNVSR